MGSTATAARLSVMMFIQFFIWGAWYVTAPLYLGPVGFGPADIGSVYAVGPLAGILSPFIVGMIADRFFSTERVLGVLHLLGAGMMYTVATKIDVDVDAGVTLSETEVATVISCIFGYMLCYYPTLALTNSLAMHNITDSEKTFPLIRVFGTIGWIVPGVFISFMNWDSTINFFWMASYASIVMGLYCFTLPHTPPPAKGKSISVREILGLDALVLLKRPSYLAFMVSSFLICIPLAFYYQIAAKYIGAVGVENPAFKMSFGQMSEIVFMLAMPFFFKRLGVKKMLLIGMLAWVVRYALFAFGADGPTVWMLIGGILLHGICYDFFFVTGQIYTDKVAGPEIRGQAQGMLVLFTLGFGMMIGAKVAGYIEGYFSPADAPVDWQNLWLVPAIASAVVFVFFALVFKDKVSRDIEPVEESGDTV
ncbi:Putative nucleoside transporter YegT [Polystyrenella longa]|uniref:Nucleoside transporter YegT n=1 Tax=Polystyrenella longa TaxID=2528007 RepID=A0A518CQA6_9PLAN|nr:nucleoside permease [Polystyrenella longa]QDU81408.1 Putative nucleoside transporter YegT [Polystyrenella longa]